MKYRNNEIFEIFIEIFNEIQQKLGLSIENFHEIFN